MRRARAGADDGQIMILTLGFVVVALLLVTVVASAAHVHLERKRLLALADVLALEGADAVASDRYFAPGSDEQPGLPLTDTAVRQGIEEYLRDNPDVTGQWDQLVVLSATTPDGASARVHLGAVTHPVLISWVLSPWQDGIALEAESVARAS
ncbi:pilus assembly protein TadG-related protein [Cellulomonas sp. URHE0023]|uniref:pilus assembly protein TadG-related protein n=1 Tax=Cellulomonas sp. URHE0023 TaxID=1380354 RepID=UPI00048507F9|nr:pilus assembly protein TadG-related protein [Cellulomonas sp. URHE0023]